MKQKKILLLSVLIFTLCIIAAYSPAVRADEIKHMSIQNYEKLSQGGLLYDKWYSVLDVKTDGTHPAYPAEGKKKGGSTWRCKECHGWDYKGKDGAYKKGSHYSGIKGIRRYVEMAPDKIAAVLKNDTHAYGGKLTDSAIDALSLFVSRGQVDMDKYIDPSTKKAAGDLNNGARIYTNTCAKCHGADGRAINFKTAEKPQYLGTLTNKNPWESLHKIRYGQPSSAMPALLFMSINDQVDVLSYCQSLPVK